MRWVFLTLLLLNFLVFAAQWLQGGHFQPQPVSALSAAAQGKALVLLSEVAGGDAGFLEQPSASTSYEDLEALCLMVGPAPGQVQAQDLVQVLRHQGVGARVVTQEVVKAPDYWVYIPPLADRDAAIQMLRELQKTRKIDSYLISQGPLANGISLGLFKNREAAVALQEQRAAEGLDAQLIEVERTGIQFWVVIPSEVWLSNEQKLTKLLSEREFSAERRQIYCKSVASTKKVP